VFERGVIVLPQYRPWLLRILGAIDDLLFRLRAPQVLDVVAIATIVALAVWIIALVV
jgi:hypothetical protein